MWHLAEIMYVIALETVPMAVKTDTGEQHVNLDVLQIVRNGPVTVQMDFVSAASLVTGEIHAIHNVHYIVSKQFVIKPMVAVHRDVHQDIMETYVIEHAVTGV